MHDPTDPTPDELAACEAELAEWDRLRVQDYWAAVMAEELGAAEEIAPRLPAPAPLRRQAPAFRPIAWAPNSGEAA